MSEARITPVILSGGSGTRLWPLSRRLSPKQLLPLVGAQTLLQQTVSRVAGRDIFAPPLLVAGEDHRFIIAEQLRQTGHNTQALILEPEGRNTAPAIALAALFLRDADPDALMLIIPSDHVIADKDKFHAHVRQARTAAQQGYIVTFGIIPDRPETGFGYIKAGLPLSEAAPCHHVVHFVEKPQKAEAETYLSQKNHYWNAGIFLMGAAKLCEELRRFEPDLMRACEKAMAGAVRDMDFLRPHRDSFEAATPISIDHAVMERTDQAAVLPMNVGWSDVGSWDALWAIANKDAHGNASRGKIAALDTRNSLLHSDGPMVAVIGLDGYAVIATKDAVLVTPRNRAHDVRDVVAALRAQDRHEERHHTRILRPWGAYETVDTGQNFQVKRIVVEPGKRLSLQKHHRRAEHWVVVQGVAHVVRGEEDFILRENQSTYIPLGVVHRLSNPGSEPLHLIEIQSGDYLGEDDIVRLEDDFNRTADVLDGAGT